jgi:hypothetical protein
VRKQKTHDVVDTALSEERDVSETAGETGRQRGEAFEAPRLQLTLTDLDLRACTHCEPEEE